MNRSTMCALAAACTLAAIMAAGSPATAQDQRRCVPTGSDLRTRWVFQSDNDLFSPTKADRHYTNGVRLTYAVDEGADENFLTPILRWADVAVGGGSGTCSSGSFSIGQNMYTPERIDRAVPDPRDRPYAGWLHGTLGLRFANSVNGRPVSDTNLELSLGVVGPAAFGKQAQRFVHRLIDSPDPRGWSHQLRNEPAAMFTLEHRRLGYDLNISDKVRVGVVPHVGATVGNVHTHGSAGLTLFAGEHQTGQWLDLPFRIRPAIPGSGSYSREPISALFFVSAEARLVGRNIFLDGNTFEDSPRVGRKPFVADVQAGVALTVDRFRASYTMVYRTREFDGQRQPDIFGSVTVSFAY